MHLVLGAVTVLLMTLAIGFLFMRDHDGQRTEAHDERQPDGRDSPHDGT